jgi:hypothetical protein
LSPSASLINVTLKVAMQQSSYSWKRQFSVEKTLLMHFAIAKHRKSLHYFGPIFLILREKS